MGYGEVLTEQEVIIENSGSGTICDKGEGKNGLMKILGGEQEKVTKILFWDDCWIRKPILEFM